MRKWLLIGLAVVAAVIVAGGATVFRGDAGKDRPGAEQGSAGRAGYHARGAGVAGDARRRRLCTPTAWRGSAICSRAPIMAISTCRA